MNKKMWQQMLAVTLLCLLTLSQNLAYAATIAGGSSPATPNAVPALSLSGGASISFTEASKKLLLNFCAESGEAASILEKSLQKFEDRLRLHTEELNKCYSLLCGAIDRGTLQATKDSHVELLKHLIIELGDSSQVNQGNHNTCTLAALETKLYNESPSVVCSIVLQALTGTVTGINGQTATIPAAMLEPDRESQLFRIGSPCRSFSSQLFQIAVANLYWQSQTKDPRGIKVPLGSMSYIQQSGGPMFHGDTSERLVIKWADDIREHVSSPCGLPENSPAFSMTCLMGAYEMLTGRSAKDFLLAHKSRPENKPATLFGNMSDLGNKLSNLKRSGQLPAIMAIHPDGGIIQTAPRLRLIAGPGVLELATPKSTSWHVVCITDYTEDSDEIHLDNFWGPRSDFVNDRSLHLSELYSSSFEAKSKK
jgi:hypothetical protein